MLSTHTSNVRLNQLSTLMDIRKDFESVATFWNRLSSLGIDLARFDIEAWHHFGRSFTPVDILLESLHEPAIAEVEPAWELEIERRLAQYDRGETNSIDANEVFAKARSMAR